MVDIIYYAYERTILLKLAFLVRVEQFLEQPTFLSSQDQNSVSEGQSISTASMSLILILSLKCHPQMIYILMLFYQADH